MENRNQIFKEPILSINSMNELSTHLCEDGSFFYALFGLVSSARALFIYTLGHEIKRKLVILQSETEARKLFDEYRSFDRECSFYPAKDLLFYEADIRSNELTTQRIRVIKNILENDRVTVFTSIEAVLGRLPGVEAFCGNEIILNTGDIIDLDDIAINITKLGYQRSGMVDTPGEYSIRGGILDIFPLTENFPIRIELWSDEIDSIRTFDVQTQKSIDIINTVKLFPASEEKLYEEHKSENNQSLLMDFFGQDSCIFLEEPSQLINSAEALFAEYSESMKRRGMLDGTIEKDEQDIVGNIIAEPGLVLDSIKSHKALIFASLSSVNSTSDIKKSYHIETAPVISFNNSIPLLKKELNSYRNKGYKIIICGQSKSRQKRLQDSLMAEGIECYFSEDLNIPVERGQVAITVSAMGKGVELVESKSVYISENDIFSGEYKRKRKKTYQKGDVIESFRELNVGDYVVHENYGMGIYRGIEKIEQDKITKDFLKISYAGSDNLYIPVSQLDLITKYSGSEAKVKLSSLTGTEWKKTKDRVRSAVGDMAKELGELYAKRNELKGYACGEDTAWQREFEETFPYEETPGQLIAIEEVKRDLMSDRVMDRLICGDVGFGKTEVALRAAFKMVQENKQVVVLSPTTVLAKQHFNTFSERMKDYPISVGLLSRFRTAAENKETVKKLNSGELDIVIGTHRALSKDVHFKDLGLLVIDEEQRFGVKHKERIKQLKNSVDVLSLSATPIPRTLHMSLVGIRDMSLLDEAPLERSPIQTFILEENDEMIREAIERELSRGGQVYYVANRVRGIAELAAKIRNLVPNASVAYAHGQMTESRLEDIMSDFVDREIDVLVATTIIEIGLDISNVNTIIIHDADTFGLSQLYQLRGRVGRSSRIAYAFLMYKRDKLLKEVAQKRLMAIKEFQSLGSGFKIAMRDLEIRGAGAMLGKEQHGHIEMVGYDLYCKLLSNALREQRGEEVLSDYETSIDIMSDAYIPESYIEDEMQKLEIYKRISFVGTKEAELDMVDELIDRFGEPPDCVLNLIRIARLKNHSHGAYITKIQQFDRYIKVEIFANAKFNPEAIPEFINEYRGQVKFQADPKAPAFYIKIKNNIGNEQVLSLLKDFVNNVDIKLKENIA